MTSSPSSSVRAISPRCALRVSSGIPSDSRRIASYFPAKNPIRNFARSKICARFIPPRRRSPSPKNEKFKKNFRNCGGNFFDSRRNGNVRDARTGHRRARRRDFSRFASSWSARRVATRQNLETNQIVVLFAPFSPDGATKILESGARDSQKTFQKIILNFKF